MTLGERIGDARSTRGMSLRCLAREVGVSASFVSDIERNKRMPSMDVMARMCMVLDIDKRELIDLDPRFPLSSLKDIMEASPHWIGAMHAMVAAIESGVVSPDDLERLCEA